MKLSQLFRKALALGLLVALSPILGSGLSSTRVIMARTDASIQTNFKVAFIGDQGLGINQGQDSGAVAVLELIKSEGAQMVLHQGDFDYHDDPASWDQQINQVLGIDFPYFASVGNHDVAQWSGYQAKLEARLARIEGESCVGDLGVNSACSYRGLFFILSGIGTLGTGHVEYIAERLASSNSIWKICSWHKNQRLMQVGGKEDEVGWGPYEECRKAGAIIATGHEHSYERTHPMISFESQSIASTSNTLEIEKGKTFAFVSGLGGRSIRGQNDELAANPWWAAIYTSEQGANYGALFCTFNVNGVENRAYCYFKDIDGVIADGFEIISLVNIPRAVPGLSGVGLGVLAGLLLVLIVGTLWKAKVNSQPSASH